MNIKTTVHSLLNNTQKHLCIIRYHDTRHEVAQMVGTKLNNYVNTLSQGIGIHTFNRKTLTTAFASTNILTPANITKTYKNVILQSNNANKKVAGIKYLTNFSYDKQIKEKPIEDIAQIAKNLAQQLEKLKNIVKSNVSITFNTYISQTQETQEVLRHKFNDNSISDATFKNIIVKIHVEMIATNKKDKEVLYFSTWGYPSNIDVKITSLLKEISTNIPLAIQLLQAQFIDGSQEEIQKANLILDASVTNLLIHEALGHAAEGDHIYTRSSILHNKLGQAIAAPHVSIYEEQKDFEYGWQPFSAYGIPREKVEIIKNGKFNDFMSDIGYYKGKPHGYARAQNYNALPIPRMSRTVLALDQKHQFTYQGSIKYNQINKIYNSLLEKQIIMTNKPYLLLADFLGGTTTTENGQFQATAQKGWLLYQGKIKLYKHVSFSGNTLEVLKNIKYAASNTQKIIGTCGKNGQNIPVMAVMPTLTIVKRTKYINVT